MGLKRPPNSEEAVEAKVGEVGLAVKKNGQKTSWGGDWRVLLFFWRLGKEKNDLLGCFDHFLSFCLYVVKFYKRLKLLSFMKIQNKHEFPVFWRHTVPNYLQLYIFCWSVCFRCFSERAFKQLVIPSSKHGFEKRLPAIWRNAFEDGLQNWLQQNTNKTPPPTTTTTTLFFC